MLSMMSSATVRTVCQCNACLLPPARPAGAAAGDGLASPRSPSLLTSSCFATRPAGVWAFDHELYEEEIRARATPV